MKPNQIEGINVKQLPNRSKNNGDMDETANVTLSVRDWESESVNDTQVIEKLSF